MRGTVTPIQRHSPDVPSDLRSEIQNSKALQGTNLMITRGCKPGSKHCRLFLPTSDSTSFY